MHCFFVWFARVGRYIPVLMAMARIYWERENYPQVEKIFRQSAEFCSEHDVWCVLVVGAAPRMGRWAAAPGWCHTQALTRGVARPPGS